MYNIPFVLKISVFNSSLAVKLVTYSGLLSELSVSDYFHTTYLPLSSFASITKLLSLSASFHNLIIFSVTRLWNWSLLIFQVSVFDSFHTTFSSPFHFQTPSKASLLSVSHLLFDNFHASFYSYTISTLFSFANVLIFTSNIHRTRH